MTENLNFKPFPFLSNPHCQTVLGTWFAFDKVPVSEKQFIDLPDGDQLVLEVTTPPNWKLSDKTVMLVHGLCGSQDSGYQVRLARKFYEKGIRAVRYNMRGCGSGKGYARELYHSGRSDDVLEALKFLKKEAPDSDITLMGFSLGGNIVLKLAGELNTNASRYLHEVIAICPPIHLQKSVMRLDHSVHQLYRRYFLKHLYADMMSRHALFPDIPMPELPNPLSSFFDFDQCYVAPQSGFKSAVDYYTKSSSCQFIPHITIPCRILFAKDDPIVYTADVDDVYIPTNVRLFATDHGGHMGFIGWPQKKQGLHWMDHQLIAWVEGN